MDVISQRSSSLSSTLNPNAPMFVPLAYRTVEDFSDQWWALVQSSPWFRDYWLQERFQDPQNEPALPDLYSLFDDEEMEDDEEYQGYDHTQKQAAVVVEEREQQRELISVGALKWRKAALAESPRYAEKAPKIVNVKVSPRMIQQPR